MKKIGFFMITILVGMGGILYSENENREFQFEHISIEEGLSQSTVFCILQDSKGYMWFGTQDGLNRYDGYTFKVYTLNPENPDTSIESYINCLYEDQAGVLWIGTHGGGLNKFIPESNSFIRYQFIPGNNNSLSSSFISSICEDHTGNLWIGTYGSGFNKFDREKEIFSRYSKIDGLPNDVVFGIFYKSRKGEMFFGGLKGLNAFYPGKIKDNPHIPPVVITDFKLFNRPLAVDSDSPLKTAISYTDAITLKYNENFFTFEFAAMDFSNTGKNRYAYKLEGLDRDWIYCSANNRKANYTNIDPGNRCQIIQYKGKVPFHPD